MRDGIRCSQMEIDMDGTMEMMVDGHVTVF